VKAKRRDTGKGGKSSTIEKYEYIGHSARTGEEDSTPGVERGDMSVLKRGGEMIRSTPRGFGFLESYTYVKRNYLTVIASKTKKEERDPVRERDISWRPSLSERLRATCRREKNWYWHADICRRQEKEGTSSFNAINKGKTEYGIDGRKKESSQERLVARI